MTGIGGFLRELRRRKVYHVAVAYAIVAAAVWGAADFAFPSLGLPPSAQTLVVVLTGLGFPLALVLAWAYEVRPDADADDGTAPAPGPTAVDAEAETVVPTSAGQRSIAVLPFENMSAEVESEYFADGISEELTHALARVGDLRVAARTSAFVFRGDRQDVREIGRRLGVAHVVEGSVRRAGDRIRVTAQLVDTTEGYHLWSERFERELGDVFAIQDEIVEGVVASLLSRLPTTEPVPVLPRTRHLGAYDAYLRARHLMRRFGPGTVREAEILAEEAIARDPSFAPAHTLLVEILTLQAIGFSSRPPAALMPRAREAAERALELDPGFPEPHMALGLVHLFYGWSFADARRELERAVELGPSLSDPHFWMEFYWTYVERDEARALAANARALELNPLDPALRDRRGTVLYIFGHYEEALDVFRTLSDEGVVPELSALGMADTLFRMGRTEEAVRWARNALETGRESNAVIGVAGTVLAAGGYEEEARALLHQLRAREEAGYVPCLWPGIVHMALDEIDEAFQHLERGVDERDSSLLYLPAAPLWAGFRDDPRFPGLLRRIGLGHLVGALKAEARRD